LSHGVGSGERQGYPSAMAGLWSGLSRTLSRLELIAAEPIERLEDAADELPGLQYALHRASELTLGIEPPPGAETAHEELAIALADARDVTGEVAEALAMWGADGAVPLVHEWRGALFRVRLARLRLTGRRPHGEPQRPAQPAPFPRPALVATLLVLAGTIAFAIGAVTSFWPLWAGGLTVVSAGFLAYQP
jgi:hypothetical protein